MPSHEARWLKLKSKVSGIVSASEAWAYTSASQLMEATAQENRHGRTTTKQNAKPAAAETPDPTTVAAALRVISGEGTDADAFVVAREFLATNCPDELNRYTEEIQFTASAERLLADPSAELNHVCTKAFLLMSEWTEGKNDEPAGREWARAITPPDYISSRCQLDAWQRFDWKGKATVSMQLIDRTGSDLLDIVFTVTPFPDSPGSPSPPSRKSREIAATRGNIIRSLFFLGKIRPDETRL